MSLRVALLALLVTASLAGCSFEADGSRRTTDRTLTPVPVESVEGSDTGRAVSTPTRTPGAVPDDLPPGYGPRGLVDPDRAAATQRRALENRTRYRLAVRSAVRRDGRVVRTRRVRVVRPDATRVDRFRNGSRLLSVYATREAVYAYRNESVAAAGELDSRHLTVVGPAITDERIAPHALGVLRNTPPYASVLLRAGRFGPPRSVERGNETLLEYRATQIRSNRTPEDGPPASFEARVLVDRSGLIRAVDATVLGEVRSNRIARRHSATLRAPGTAELDTPAWLASTVMANATRRDGYVVVRNTGDRAIPLSTAYVRAGEGGYGRSLNGTLAPGERLYVAADPRTDAFEFSRRPPTRGSYDPLGDGTVSVLLGDEDVGVAVGVAG